MSSDDEDFKRAIALSLTEAKRKVNSSEPIFISSDDDEEPINVAKPETKPKSPPDTAPARPAAPDAATSTFLSERAQLEAARLARLKRMRESSQPGPAAAASSSKRKTVLEDPFVSSDDESVPPPSKKCKPSSSKSGTATATTTTRHGATTTSSQTECDMFWSGELRQTANMHTEKARDMRPLFRLHDIFGDKSELTFCIMSSYVSQLSWIYSLLPPTVPVLFVAQPGEDGAASVHNVLPNWVKVTPHLRGGRGCMHMKFMLLFYKTGRMRIAITTANLMDYDWRDIENSVWLQDIPRRSHPLNPTAKGKNRNDFFIHLEKVLSAVNVPAGLKALRVDHPEIPLNTVTDIWREWNVEKVTVKLVASLAGRYEGWSDVLDVGHTRLMRVIKDIGAVADVGDDVDALSNRTVKGKSTAGAVKERKRTLRLECQTSSIGWYSSTWIDEFFISARGTSAEEWLDAVKTKRAKEIEARIKHRGWPRIKILFPSLKTVQASRLGEDGAGTMFCQRRQWNATKFPRELFHESQSRRGRILMHSKMILATFGDSTTSSTALKPNRNHVAKRPPPSPSPDSSVTELSSDSEIEEVNPEHDERILGWIYMGSHNFTPSAWGTLSGSSFNPVMNITNYELGIVIPLTRSNQADEVVCWERPPKKYDLKTDEPWIQPT